MRMYTVVKGGVIMSKKEYSLEQLKIINGDISLEVVNPQALRRLIEKAEAHNDADLASKLKDFLLNKLFTKWTCYAKKPRTYCHREASFHICCKSYLVTLN